MNLTKNATPKPEYGTRDARGHWKPPYPARFSPLFAWPINLKAILIWLFGFPGVLWPFNTLVFLLGLVTFTFFQPSLETAKNLQVGWIGLVLLRNLIVLLVVYGSMHLAYYTFKLSGTERKYNPSFQEETKKQFLFGKQLYDNIFRTLISALPIWTAYEVLYLWAAANGRVPYLSFQEHPIWFCVYFFVLLLFRDTHFYFIHRMIHWKPLFKYVHSVHHYNSNPGPWSGLAMHAVEHLFYFTGVLLHFIIPSHPLHFYFQAYHLAVSPVVGHVGFEGPKINGKPVTSDYFHYLHHKYVTCNFGSDIVPWDRWLGIYFDGVGEYRPHRQNRDSGS